MERLITLQHFTGGGLLFQRLGQIPGPLLDLLLQVRVRLLELGGHAVELVGQRFHLVPGPDRKPMAEVPGADSGCSGLQGLDGRHHSAGEEDAGKYGNPDTHHEQEDRPVDRSVQRRKGLAQGLLDEDQPSERGDGGVGREYICPLGDLARG